MWRFSAGDSSGSGRRLRCKRGADRSRSSIDSGRSRAKPASATPASYRAKPPIPTRFRADPREIANAALNRDPRAHIRYAALPNIAPARLALFSCLRAGGPRAQRPRLARAGAPARSPSTALWPRRRGAGALLREGGWIKVFRTPRGRDRGLADAEETRALGVSFAALDREALLRARTPSRRGGDRRRAFLRSAYDPRSGGARPGLCRPFHFQGRPHFHRRRGHARDGGRRFQAGDR